MATIAQLLIKIGGDSSGLKKELAATQRQMKKAFGADSLALSSKAGKALGALGAAIMAVGTASVVTAGKMKQSAVAFETLIGSADEAKSFLKDLYQFAAETPFEVEGLQETAKKLLAFKFAAQDIIPVMSTIGDAAGMLGSGQEGIDRMTLAISQMQAKGRVMGQEMMQLAESGVNAYQYLADSMGVSIPEAMKRVEKGAVSSTAGINAILSGMQKDFAGGMAKQAKEIPGLWATVLDNTKMVMKSAGDSLIESLGIKDKLQSLADFMSQFASRVEQAGINQALKDLIPPQLSVAIFAVAGALAGAAIPAIIALGVALKAALLPLAGFTAAGAALGALAWLVWENWEPLKELFGGLWDVIYNNIKWAWSAYKAYIFTVIKAILTGVDKLFGMFGAKSPVEDWLNSVDAALQDATGNMDEAWAGMNSGMNKTKNGWKGLVKQTKSSVNDLVKNTSKLKTTFTGLSGGGGTDIKTSAQELEKLQKKAKQVSEAIENEWVQTTKTELQQLDLWLSEQKSALEQTKSQNENYQRDIERVNAVYSQRRLKILQNEQKKTADIWDKVADSAKGSQRRESSIGVSGVDQEKMEIENSAADDIDEVARKYRDWADEYASSTEAQQEQFRAAWQANGIQFQDVGNGMISFSEQIAAEQLTIEREKQQKIKDLEYERIKWEERLEQAKKDGDIARYTELLDTEQALFAEDLAGRQALMEEYYLWWGETHRTAMDYMAETLNGLYSGLENFFVDIINNAKSIGDAWQSLRGTILSMLGQMVAKWIASQLMMKVFGQSMQSAMAATSATAAGTTAMAWAPAAAAVSLASYGANAAPAMAGMGATYALSSALSAIPGLAEGGITTGPTLAMIGEGKYQEAVIPLNKRKLEKAGLAGDKGERRSMQIILQPTFNTIDGKSTQHWLDNGGGDAITKYVRTAVKEFNTI